LFFLVVVDRDGDQAAAAAAVEAVVVLKVELVYQSQ
jgi:hypothetical protein